MVGISRFKRWFSKSYIGLFWVLGVAGSYCRLIDCTSGETSAVQRALIFITAVAEFLRFGGR